MAWSRIIRQQESLALHKLFHLLWSPPMDRCARPRPEPSPLSRFCFTTGSSSPISPRPRPIPHLPISPFLLLCYVDRPYPIYGNTVGAQSLACAQSIACGHIGDNICKKNKIIEKLGLHKLRRGNSAADS